MHPQERAGDLIAVKMLGGFSMTYKGQEIALGRNSSARFVQLLQLVWLQGSRGITKEKLVEELYDREVINNVNSSFNTLVYRMRLQMQNAGLPEGEYIVRRNGVYVPDERVPVWVDALEFEELMLRADGSAGLAERVSCCQAAFELYQGDLLADKVNQLWVYEKGVKYKRMFAKCVRILGESARGNRDYAAMETVYNKAVRLYPLEDWESDLLEALLAGGKFKKARQLYNKTVRLYSNERGLTPPERMLEIYRRMGEKNVSPSGTLEEIFDSLTESPDEGFGPGAYYCAYSSFMDIYHLLSRNMERTGMSIYLMMCVLVDYEGKPISNEEKLKERSEALRTAIRTSLRQGDVFTQYSASQFLILVMNVRGGDCAAISRRISDKLRAMTSNQADLAYQVKPVAGSPPAG